MILKLMIDFNASGNYSIIINAVFSKDYNGKTAALPKIRSKY